MKSLVFFLEEYSAHELTELTNKKYQKISGSRAIGPHLSLTGYRSRSFMKFISGVRRIMALA